MDKSITGFGCNLNKLRVIHSKEKWIASFVKETNKQISKETKKRKKEMYRRKFDFTFILAPWKDTIIRR